MRNEHKYAISFVAMFLGCTACFSQCGQKETTAESSSVKEDSLPVIVGWDKSPEVFDPRLVGNAANAMYLESLLYAPLISFDKKGDVQFVLAEKMEIINGKDWKLTLRQGVKTAGGETLTVDDVIATYQALREGKMKKEDGTEAPLPRFKNFEDILKIQKISETEAVFEMSKPLPDYLPNFIVGILPRSVLAKPIGDILGAGAESGPFILKDFSSETISLIPNPHFSSDIIGIPKAQSNVIYKIITDEDTRKNALLAGEIDIIQNGLQPVKVVEIQNNYADKFDIITQPQLSTVYLGFNAENEFFKNVKVRQAVSYAINTDEILQFVMSGLGVKAKGLLVEGTQYAKPDLPENSYDIEKAKALLDEAGLLDPDGDGPGMRFKFDFMVEASRAEIAKAISGQLKKVSIEANVEVQETNIWNENIKNKRVPAWIRTWSGFKSPDILQYAFHTVNIPNTNRGWYSNPELDKVIDEAVAEINFEKRKELFYKAQDMIAQEKPYHHLWHGVGVAVVSKKIQGYEVYADGRYTALTQAIKK